MVLKHPLLSGLAVIIHKVFLTALSQTLESLNVDFHKAVALGHSSSRYSLPLVLDDCTLTMYADDALCFTL